MEFKGIMKDYKLATMDRIHLEKEAHRKGIPFSRQISWTDLALRVAYAEGYNIGKSEQSFSYPTKAAMPKAEKKKYSLQDNTREEIYYLSLTNKYILYLLNINNL